MPPEVEFNVIDWEAKLRASPVVELEFSVSAVEQRLFAELSGDFNPLHLDVNFARERGLAGAVVYGAMMLAKVSCIVGMRLPGSAGIWSSIKMDFRAPLYVDEAALLRVELTHFSPSTRSLALKISVKTAAHLIATGSALATLHEK